MYNFKTLLTFSLKGKILTKSMRNSIITLFVIGLIFPIVATIIGYFAINDFSDSMSVIGVRTDNTELIEYLESPDASSVVSGITFRQTDSVEYTEDSDLAAVYDVKSNKLYVFDQSLNTETVQLLIINKKYSLYQATSPVSTDFTNQFGSMDPASIENHTDDVDQEQYTEDDIQNQEAVFAINYGLVIIFFIIIMLAIQGIGTEVAVEKSSRAMEIILTNTTPLAHMLAKIVSTIIFSFLSVFVIAGSFIIGGIISIFGILAAISSGLLASFIPPETANIIMPEIANTASFVASEFNSNFDISMISIIAILVLFICSMFFACFAAAIFASAVTSINDFQKAQTPLQIYCMFAYFIAFATPTLPVIVCKIIAFLPIIGVFAMPTLILGYSTSIFFLLAVFAVNGILLFIVLRYGIRIYKLGLLNYSDQSITKLFREDMKSRKLKKAVN